MTTRKRNEFLEPESSGDDTGSGYDSEAQDLKGGRSARTSLHPSKRRKALPVESHESEDNLEEGHDDNVSSGGEAIRTKPASKSNKHTTYPPSSGSTTKDPSTPLLPKTKPLKPISSQSASATNARLQRTGVVYISRIPPYLTPHALRSFLEPHAPKGLSRIFLTPENPTNRRLRISNHGNKKPSFTDGWVEFVSKKEAKLAAELLNTRTFGGRGWWKDDVWNVRYLKGYKWTDLMEQIRAEEREREARLMAGVARGRKEERAFVKQVELAKVEKTREAKRAKTTETGMEDGTGEEKRRSFKQNEVHAKKVKEKETANQPEHVKRVLSKIF